jgi:ABC-type Fe3+ transport system permease subunit
VSTVVDVHALNLALWAVVISCLAAVVLAACGIMWAWLAERGRRARQIADGIRAAEAHLAAAARDRSAR